MGRTGPDDSEGAQSSSTAGTQRAFENSGGPGLTKAHQLLALLNEKLSTGFFGNVWIEGERFANRPRQIQLREVVALKKELELINANFAATPETKAIKEHVIELKKGPKPRGDDAADIRAFFLRDDIHGA